MPQGEECGEAQVLCTGKAPCMRELSGNIACEFPAGRKSCGMSTRSIVKETRRHECLVTAYGSTVFDMAAVPGAQRSQDKNLHPVPPVIDLFSVRAYRCMDMSARRPPYWVINARSSGGGVSYCLSPPAIM